MRTKRLSLTPSMSTGYGYLINHCGKRQQVNIDHLKDNGDYWCCVDCEKPLVIRLDDCIYYIGENITI